MDEIPNLLILASSGVMKYRLLRVADIRCALCYVYWCGDKPGVGGSSSTNGGSRICPRAAAAHMWTIRCPGMAIPLVSK